MSSFDDLLQPAPAAPAMRPGPPLSGATASSFDDVLQDVASKTPITEDSKREARIEAIKKVVQANSPQPQPSRLNSVNTHISDNVGFGVAKPISSFLLSALTGVTGEHPGSTFGERFQGYNRATGERAEAASKDLGAAGVPLGIAAALPANIAAGGARVLSPAKNALLSAGTGFVEGASKNSETLGGALWGGAKQAATDAAVTAGLGKVMSRFTPSGKEATEGAAKAKRGVDPEELAKNAKAHYTQLDNQGLAYSDRQLRGIMQDLNLAQTKSELRLGTDLVPGQHASVTDIVRQLDTYSKGGGATFNQLHDLRTALSKQARGQDETDRDAANVVISRLDNLIHNHSPAVNPKNIDVGGLHKRASELWKAKSVAEDTGYVADKVQRNAAWKGGNPDKATRSAFAAVQDRTLKPDAYNPFDKTERDLLAQIVSGTKAQNRRAGAGSLLRENAPAIGGAAAGAASLGGLLKGFDLSATAPAAAVGFPAWAAAKFGGRQLEKSADKIGQESVNKLMRQITTGTTDLPAYGANLSRDELAKLQFNQLIARMAPKTAQDNAP